MEKAQEGNIAAVRCAASMLKTKNELLRKLDEKQRTPGTRPGDL